MEEKSSENREKLSVPGREEEILAFWKEHDIFNKSLKQTESGEPYVFYDGPPFATGLPHYGHLLQGTIKDIIPRYQTMRGRYVRREWGWDCHGLPIENLIEKELGFKHKKEIEEYGIAKFNQKARESVLMYDKEWHVVVDRMARWIDMDHGYKTMDSSYTDSIWWAFGTLYGKKLIYEGYKAMHICPRCETTLAASEVALGYKDVKDISVYVKFELVDEPNTFLIAWTTTPWTLPGNVALAINPDISYSKFTLADSTEIYIAATERLAALAGEKTILGELNGKDLIGKSYKPVFDDYAKDETLPHYENGWKVYAADFVTTDSGTGIVHIAPAFGESDMELGKKMKLPFIQHVGMDGKVRPEVKAFAGMYVKPKSDDDKERLSTDIAVLKYLQEHGNFFAKENIVHSYPHCWRCDWPLLNYAASSWFVAVSGMREKLLEANRNITWVPENMRDGRFGKWLEGARDWAISRSRYWGAPIPVWKCNKCGKVDVVSSLGELKKRTTRKNRYLIMRHGAAETNAHDIVSYKLDDHYPLTAEGRAQVAASAQKLKDEKIDLIVASPILRTKETATIVAEAIGYNVGEIIDEPRLLEANTGTFNGKNIAEYRAYFTSAEEKFAKRPPEGETLEEMKSRLAEFLYETEAANEGKTILIVTHEYAVWLLESAARGLTNHEAAELRDGEGEDFIGNADYRELPFAPIPHNERYELDFHRPFIDDVTYHCTCELGMLERVPEVFDCWFESGSMPFAQFHYMGDDKSPEGKLFNQNFPADFIAEAVDQTRGWFYTMLILSVGLFDRAAFKCVNTTGLILAEDGQKMSKKLKNYPDPMTIAAKYGADAIRFYMVASPVVRGEELRFATSGVDEVFKKIILRTGNVLSFLEMYGFGGTLEREAPKSTNVLDQWIIARFNETLAEVTKNLDTHELDYATRPMPKFVDDLSTWYLRRSRDRFKSDDVADMEAVRQTTAWVLFSFARMMAPFMPFLAEDIYQKLSVVDKKESVHLESWPEAGTVNAELLSNMQQARDIVSLALEARAKAGIKVRQPLAKLTAPELPEALSIIVADEVNVKEIAVGDKLELDTTLTSELKQEGVLRDLIRHVQELRKKNAFVPSDLATITIATDEKGKQFIETVKHELMKLTNTGTIEFADVQDSEAIKTEEFTLAVRVTK